MFKDRNLQPQQRSLSDNYDIRRCHTSFSRECLYDGGAVWALDVVSAVTRCKEITPVESEIVIDIGCLIGNHIEDVQADNLKTLGMYQRYQAIESYFNGADSVERAIFTFRDVKFRYTIIPTRGFPSGRLPIKFDYQQIQEMYVLGYEDTKAVIELGEEVSTKLWVEHANAVRFDGYQGSLLDFHN